MEALLLDAANFRALVSGHRRGLRAAALRGVLRMAEVPYTMAVCWRNARYDRGRAETFSAGVPVISVGNLTVGGTGKTPMVEWIARWLRQRGLRVVLISRGYGAKQGSRNDEALELEQKLPGVPHLQDPNRVAAARVAVEELAAQVILLDDGFQHRRLCRDLDIVLLDALAPWGHRHVFPRGFLREPVTALRRAQMVCLSRADLLDASERQKIRDEVRRLAPKADWLEAAHAPQALRSPAGEVAPLSALQGQTVAAFCGLGNPDGFRRTLAQLPYRLAGFREFPDHHAYQPADLAALATWARQLQAQALLCTHKDLVKIGVEHLCGLPLWAVGIGLDFLVGREMLAKRLEQTTCR